MSARREFSYRKTWRIGDVVGLDVHVQADILRVRCIIREAAKVAGADGDTVNLLRVPEAYRKEKLCYANTFELRLENAQGEQPCRCVHLRDHVHSGQLRFLRSAQPACSVAWVTRDIQRAGFQQHVEAIGKYSCAVCRGDI